VKIPNADNSIKMTIEGHRKIINFKVKEARYLKVIYNHLNELKDLIEKSVTIQEFEVLARQLDLIFDLITIETLDDRKNNYAYHELYKLLEGFIKSENVFVTTGNEAFVIVKNQKVLVRRVLVCDKEIQIKELYREKANFKHKLHKKPFFHVVNKKVGRIPNYLETFFIVNSLLHVRYGLKADDKKMDKWVGFNEKRNKKTGHGSNEKATSINSDEITSFLDFLSFIFNKENQKETNAKRYVNEFSFNSDYSNKSSGNNLGDVWPREKK
jgi:hypothetical protein